jgi:membrane protease YdiL (CAAX protease family)
LVLGAAVGSLLFLLVVLAASFAGLLQVPAGGANDDLLIGVTFATFLTVFQSYGEELFFRGWLQPILATEWGLLVGLGVSSVLFALAHWVTQDVGALAVFNIGLAGLMFGLMALRTGGLATPFAAHATWNWLEQSGLGLAPNPGVDGLGALIDLDLVGSNVLSGGTDGLNGSLLVTCVLALAVVAFLSPVFVKDPADRLQRRS